MPLWGRKIPCYLNYRKSEFKYQFSLDQFRKNEKWWLLSKADGLNCIDKEQSRSLT